MNLPSVQSETSSNIGLHPTAAENAAPQNSKGCVHFQRFDPAGCNFPKPAVPLLPPLQLSGLTLISRVAAKKKTAIVHKYFMRGRYALQAAYDTAGIGPHGALLAPAYHCRTMLDAAIILQAPILLYSLTKDLLPELVQLQETISRYQQDTLLSIKALLLPHYFGIEQPQEIMAKMIEICEANKIMLIEDCSHICTEAPGISAGTYAHCGVSSPYKFFPAEDGGELWFNKHLTDQAQIATQKPTMRRQIKAWARAAFGLTRAADAPPPELSISVSTSLGEHQVPHAVNACDALSCGSDKYLAKTLPSENYVTADSQIATLSASRWIVRHTKLDALCLKRRANFNRWLLAVEKLPACRPIYAQLPETSVPYMFPLWIDHPEPHFFALKRLGMPIWRWDDMAVSPCSTATAYRLHLLHLPCHQQLSDDQMQWMIDALTGVLRNVNLEESVCATA